MTITLPEFLTAAACMIAVGWLWASGEAAVLAPVQRSVHAWLARGGPARRWLLEGSQCPACSGFWPGLAMVTIGEGVTVWTVPLALSALVLHLAWLRVIALTGVLILR